MAGVLSKLSSNKGSKKGGVMANLKKSIQPENTVQPVTTNLVTKTVSSPNDEAAIQRQLSKQKAKDFASQKIRLSSVEQEINNFNKKPVLTKWLTPLSKEARSEIARRNAVNQAKSTSGAIARGVLDTATLGSVSSAERYFAKRDNAPSNFDIAQEAHPKAYAGGQIAGYLLPGSGATKVTSKVAAPIINKVGSVLGKRVVEGAISGAGMELAEGIIRGKKADEIAKNVGLGVAIGAAGDVALSGLGAAAKAIAKKIKAGKILTVAEKELAVKSPDLMQQIRNELGITDEGWTINAKSLQSEKNPLLESIRKDLNIEPTGTVTVKKTQAELPKVSESVGAVKQVELPNVNSKTEQLEATRKAVVGGEPTIPEGKVERGFNVSNRADVNNPDALRDSLSEKPMTYEQVSNTDTLKKAQDIMSQGYESARSQVGKLAEDMKPESVPLAKLLARQATEAGNVQGAREILSDVAEKLTRAGQFTQAAKLLRESDPETFLMTIDKQLRKLNEDGLKQYGKKWTNFDLTPDEIDMINKLPRGDQAAYESAMEQIGKRIANEMPASAVEKLNTWRHMAMLLNPKTQIRNVAGNTLMMGMRRTAKEVSAVLQNIVLPKEARTQAIWVKPEYKQAAKDYFEANKKDLLGGANKFNEGVRLNMPNERVFKTNALEGVKNFTYNALQWGDNPFYKNAYVNRLASYAQAKGIKDLSQLGEEAFAIAKKEADEATYKDASILASTLNKWKHPGKDASFGKKTLATMAEVTMPFTKTPINVIKRGIQYSPAGIINGLSKIKSAEGAANAIDEMAKGLTGTGILGLGYLLASKGILTGKAETDADLKSYNANTGNSPFSILGKYTYDWMQPFSVPLSVGVEIYNALKDNPKEAAKMETAVENGDSANLEMIAQKIGNGLYNSFVASGDTVFNMSVLKGIKQMMQNGVMQSMIEAPANLAMQLIPTVSSQITGTVDPTVRQTYYNGSPLETFKATALSKIPFASKLLQPKITTTGETVLRPSSPFTRAVSQFVSPGNISVPQNINPTVDAEIRRLNTDAGEKKQFPQVAPNKFAWNDKEITLTPTEYTQFQKTLGQQTMIVYAKVMASKDYKTASDADKATMLSNAISEAKKQAQFETLKNRGIVNNPLIMKMPSTLTKNKQEYTLTEKQKEQIANDAKKIMSYGVLKQKEAIALAEKNFKTTLK